MLKSVVLTFIFLLAFVAVRAQDDVYFEEDSTETTFSDQYGDFDTTSSSFAKDVIGDTTVNFRGAVFNDDSLRLLKLRKPYGWSSNLDSLLADLQNRDSNESTNFDTPSSANNPFGSGILQVILWVLAGGFVLFILAQLFLTKGAFRRQKSGVKPLEEEEEINIAGRDFPALIQKAKQAGNFRSATRYLFLMTLQKLQEKEMMVFSPDKTNNQYLNELPPARKSGFATLALYYEYIWYGQATLSTEKFDSVEVVFMNFLNSVR